MKRTEGYVATDVKCEGLSDSGGAGRYRVRDFWSGHRGFEVFRERFSEDFAQFDEQIVNDLVEREEFVGAYYEADCGE
jgi:hypothetical protein